MGACQKWVPPLLMIWHTEVRAMKTVVAGAVGANCAEANLTHCGPSRPPPPPLLRKASVMVP